MLEFCVAEASGGRRVRANLSFIYIIFSSFNESLVKLCRMIFLHKALTQLLWNDILVKKDRVAPPPQQIL